MNTVIRFDDSLAIFRTIILLYRDQDGNLFAGKVFRSGDSPSADWSSVFHKEPIPEKDGIIMGWNELDDYYPSMKLVPEEKPETGVEDFLYAHNAGTSWKSLDYNVITTFSEMETFCRRNPIKKGTACAFCIRL